MEARAVGAALSTHGLFKKTKIGEICGLSRPLAWRQKDRQDEF